MLERVVENWLNRVNESSQVGPRAGNSSGLEIPFCQLLTAEGYEVIHLSRHGPTEQGKDVLAIAPDGTPCAYQLKGLPGRRFTLRNWERELDQIIRLVEIPIVHPSINPDIPRRVYLVTNGDLDEEVRREIDDRNRDWERRNHPRLETIVKGQLLTRFAAITTNFWPIPLQSERTLLEFFLSGGNSYLPKAKLSSFLLPLLPVNDEEVGNTECSRSIANTAIITTYALSRYQEVGNHVALIEGWMIYIASVVALIEKRRLPEEIWQDSIDTAIEAIEIAFEDLCTEVQARQVLIEGEALVDAPFYRGRITWLTGLLSTYLIWRHFRSPDNELRSWITDFVFGHLDQLLLWGEGAVPHFLAVMWLSRLARPGNAVQVLSMLVESICTSNENNQINGLPDPYQELGDVIARMYRVDNGRTENYRGRSYSLRSLIHLLTRRNWRQQMRFFWPRITHIHFAEFLVEEPWQFCIWRVENHGSLQLTQPSMPQSWRQLQQEAEEIDVSSIPQFFIDNPELLLLFLTVYPHRLTTNSVKVVDNLLRTR